MNRRFRIVLGALIVGMLASCTTRQPAPSGPAEPPPVTTPGPDTAVLGPSVKKAASRWTPVRWSDLPGFSQDNFSEAWNAWLKSCERPMPTVGALCKDVRRLTLATPDEQRGWMQVHLQPYRVEPLDGSPTEGLLTSYYEPLYQATRLPQPGVAVPLLRPPPSMASKKPWYTRQQMDTLPEARAAWAGSELMYLADPVDAMVLQIQGSGRMQVTEPSGQQRLVRLAYAATNEQPYKSIGKWLLDRGEVRDATWPGIKAWIFANPERTQELLWSNPRVVFFREEPLSELDAQFGPKGAQGVPLTPGRSIAVDPGSIPYGTPVWLTTSGPQANLQRLVMAQDTGSAIRGAVRADYFAGWGPEAGEFAGRLKQNLRLWVLWPK
jgi:membrane-bound lytic murein transglycosylase A